MTTDQKKTNNLNAPTIYQITVKGTVDSQSGSRFEGFSIDLDKSGNTRLTGSVIDQAALHGLLKKIRDLGMTLESIMQVQGNEPPLTIYKEETEK